MTNPGDPPPSSVYQIVGVNKKDINLIIGTGRQAGMSEREIAYTLATASVESGFNPEAAAHESSASGIGQFVNLTGKSYNINKDTRLFK